MWTTKIGRFVGLAMVLATVPACGDDEPGPGGDPATGGAPGTGGTPAGPADRSCPWDLTVDGEEFHAVSCAGSAGGLFNGGYQISLTGAFNTIVSGPVRSIMLTLADDHDDPFPHANRYPVSVDKPGAAVVYSAPRIGEKWATERANPPPAHVTGSGSVLLSTFDQAAKKAAGSYDAVVELDGETKTVSGTFRNVPIEFAE